MLVLWKELKMMSALEIKNNEPLTIQTDSEMYKIALRNLISNALKYSPPKTK